MDAISFRTALAATRPSIASLLNAGLSRDEAQEFASSFEVLWRSEPEHFSLPDSALEDLFSKSDVSQIEIGMVRFHERRDRTSNGWSIGNVEADQLMLDEKSGEILVRDITSLDHIIWKCAKDGGSFLSALAVAVKYLTASISEDEPSNLVQQSTLENCISLAGGSTYSSFYEMLIG